MDLETLKAQLDENDNNELEEEKLETIGFELDDLKNELINNQLDRIAKKYAPEIKDKLITKKREYLILFSYAKQILGSDFEEQFLTEQGPYNIPLEEITYFISSILINEKNMELLKTKEIILTIEELEELNKILNNDNDDDKKKFINKQLSENITSQEIISGTKLEEKIESFDEDASELIKNLDLIWYEYLKSKLPDTSKDTLRNMATGITFAFLKLFNDLEGGISTPIMEIKNFEDFKNITKQSKNIDFINKNQLLINSIKKLKETENNALLMNSGNFANFYYELITKDIKEEDIDEKIKSYDNNNIDLEKAKKALQQIGNNSTKYLDKKHIKTVGIAGGVSYLLRGFESAKEELNETLKENADKFMEMKENLEKVGIFGHLKEFINKIFELLGFEKGWDEFEQKINKEKFKDILDFLKNYIDIKNIKEKKKSIFYKGFEDKIKKLKNIQVEGHLSYQSLKKLDKIKGTNTETKLENFFKTQNFDNIFKSKNDEKNFYKKTFSTKKIQKGDEKIKIGIINFNKIDEVIKENLEFKAKENSEELDEIV